MAGSPSCHRRWRGGKRGISSLTMPMHGRLVVGFLKSCSQEMVGIPLLSVVTGKGEGKFSIVLRNHHCLRKLNSGTSSCLWLAMNIHKDTGCNSTMNPDMTSGSAMGPDVTMASGVSKGHSNHYVSQWQHGPQISLWSQVAAHAFSGNSGHVS